jgi:hypothetical protein
MDLRRSNRIPPLLCLNFELRRDGSAVVAHRARVTDEGRPLLPVAQLTDRWGSHQTPTGKTIWAEQTVGKYSHTQWEITSTGYRCPLYDGDVLPTDDPPPP